MFTYTFIFYTFFSIFLNNLFKKIYKLYATKFTKKIDFLTI